MSETWIMYEREPHPSRWQTNFVRGLPVNVLSRHRSYGAAAKTARQIRRAGRNPIHVSKVTP